jgi:hypothetical protein
MGRIPRFLLEIKKYAVYIAVLFGFLLPQVRNTRARGQSQAVMRFAA